VAETVHVTRGGQTHTFVVAEEHDDGSLLLRPESAPASNGGAVTDDSPQSRRERVGGALLSGQGEALAASVAAPGDTSLCATEIDAILEVRGLSVSYGSKRAVSDVSFQIRRGEIFGLLGPNGAGKTSTLSAIEGLVKPEAGTVVLDEIDVRRHPAAARARMGVQLQATSFQSELTIKQIVRLYAGLYGMALADAEITDSLRAIGLDGEAAKPFKQLSGGQQQRLSLYIAVVHEPLLLLLDEPTAGLDPQSRRQLWGRIEQLRQDGGSILLTTHSMEEAQAVCDRVAIIDNGILLTTETPRNLIEKHRDDPRVRAVAHGDVTLEDVFIGLTGSEIRD
jgi:ABC-2 type transport system ATP-binding protein